MAPGEKSEVLLGVESAERGVRADGVVVGAPLVTDISRVLDAREAVLVQQFIADASIEGLKDSVKAFSTGLPGRMKRCSMPGIEGAARELRSVVGPDRSRLAVLLDRLVEGAEELSWPLLAATRYTTARSHFEEKSDSCNRLFSRPTGSA
jgi:hypothetical protein